MLSKITGEAAHNWSVLGMNTILYSLFFIVIFFNEVSLKNMEVTNTFVR